LIETAKVIARVAGHTVGQVKASGTGSWTVGTDLSPILEVPVERSASASI